MHMEKGEPGLISEKKKKKMCNKKWLCSGEKGEGIFERDDTDKCHQQDANSAYIYHIPRKYIYLCNLHLSSMCHD